MGEHSAGTLDDRGQTFVTVETDHCLLDELGVRRELGDKVDATLEDPQNSDYSWDGGHMHASWQYTNERGVEMLMWDDRLPGGG